MTKEKLLQELKYTQKKHQNDHVDTFGTNISLMCADIVNVLNRCVEIPEEATNGEVFMKMHPNFRVVQSGMVSVTIKDEFDNETDFSLDWWNQKWGE